ncbi:MAG: cyclic nucleotide-binding domain-containing protein, partial [Cyanobacteriota bacterium]
MNALDTMRALASKGEVIDVQPGALIFKAGEAGDCMFGLLEGTVELSWNGDLGHEQIHRALQQAEHAVACLSGFEDQRTGLDIDHFALA